MNTVSIMQKVVPNSIQILERRYAILKGIEMNQPIGRRSLSGKIDISERVLRADTDFLKIANLIDVTASGMSLTYEGEDLITHLEKIMHNLKGFDQLEKVLTKILDGVTVNIVEGDSDRGENTKDYLGKEAARLFNNYIKDDSIIAITGGSTIYQVVNELKDGAITCKEALVIPARGGLGNNVEYQANTLASKFAHKIGASYKLLNVPDNLSKKALKSVRKEPQIKETLEYISKASLIIFGIGDAYKMAKRRNLSDSTIDLLKKKHAVAEAFGYYFNEDGEIVYTSRSIGVQLEMMKTFPESIAVAGGSSKAKAIYALRKYLSNGHLIIDEGAAREIVRLYQTRV